MEQHSSDQEHSTEAVHDAAATVDSEEFDRAMMRRALELARRGSGFVSPNPMVGAIITGSDRTIIAEAWHERFGGPHAEANALREVAGRPLHDATMYVTLEPCNHHGKTPPCTDALVASGIRRVVIGSRDPNPVVRGRGVKRLREAGIEVVVGVLEQEAVRLNESYIHFITTGKPFVTVKMAQTLDGFIALPDGESQWITGELARERVHQLRAANDAIIIGSRTALHDDPSLTVRFGIKGRNPRRVIFDETLSLPGTLKVFSDEHRELTHVFTTAPRADSPTAVALREHGVTVHGVGTTAEGMLQLDEIFTTLGELGVASVLVEGGSSVAGSIVGGGHAHKIMLFIAPKLFGEGIKGFLGPKAKSVEEAHRVDIYRAEMVGEDVLLTAYWHRS